MQRIVRKLTMPIADRQRFDASAGGRSRLLLAVAAVALLTPGTDAAAKQAWQPTEDITATAESYLQHKTGRAANRTTLHAGTLDARHRLPLCDQPLEGFMRRGARISSRTIVGVRCNGSKPWKVYVPVDVVVMANVLTARHVLPRGHLVTKADIAIVERDVSRMISGYLSDPQALAGQRLKQQLLAGQVITPAMLAADQIVRRGQSVTLMATGGGVNIRMSGKALMNGALHQRIRVENSNSGRVVEGIVRSPEHVEVIVSANSGFFSAKPKVSPNSADTQVSNNDR
ncbi:MAG: flagellar basal body P-ring formation chaperone FlgA [Gammaproteobacteria bacterium]|nr:flagellar basal body P-ring formation chaperone FlgA [Gammaproteobacteria bacterium]